jgi:hypothetical protein
MPRDLPARYVALDLRSSWPALISLFLPLIFALVILDMTIKFLLPPISYWPKFSGFLISELEAKVADIQGRMSFAVASSFVRVLAVGAIAAAYLTIRQRFGAKAAGCALVPAILVGAVIGKYLADNDISLVDVVYGVLKTAQDAGIVPPDTIGRTHSAIAINMVLGVAGVVSLLVAFASVAIRARVDELDVRRLQLRLSGLRLVTLCGAALLVFLVVVGKALLAWPHSLIGEAARKSFGQLAASVVNSWGACGSAILLCALLPAFYSFKIDVEKAASMNRVDDVKHPQDWIKANQLEFAPLSLIGAAIASAAPMLAGPAIDVANALTR